MKKIYGFVLVLSFFLLAACSNQTNSSSSSSASSSQVANEMDGEYVVLSQNIHSDSKPDLIIKNGEANFVNSKKVYTIDESTHDLVNDRGHGSYTYDSQTQIFTYKNEYVKIGSKEYNSRLKKE